MSIFGLFIAFVFIAVAVRYGRFTVPKGCKSPFKMKLMLAAEHLSGDVMYVLGKLGLGITRIVEVNQRLLLFMHETSTSSDAELKMRKLSLSGVPILIYEPRSLPKSGLRSAIVYFHGGGWVYGSAAWVHSFTRLLAIEARAVVISVDYRLAPRHVYPAAFDDCMSVVRELLEDGERTLRIDTRKLAVAGDSAGGNLAAAVSQELRLEKKRPFLQLLIYPTVQLFHFNSTSHRRYSDDDLLSRANVAAAISLYSTGSIQHQESLLSGAVASPETMKRLRTFMPDATETPREISYDADELRELEEKLVSERMSPLMARSVHGLPATYVLIAEIDVLRSEGVSYANRLRSEGVNVKLREAANQRHGFLMEPDMHYGADDIIADMGQFFQRHTEAVEQA